MTSVEVFRREFLDFFGRDLVRTVAFIVGILTCISLFALIIGYVPITPVQWSKFSESVSSGELWGAIFIAAAFWSSIFGIITIFLFRISSGVLMIVSSLLLVLGTVIAGKYLEFNPFYLYLIAILLLITGFLTIISNMNKRQAQTYIIAYSFLFLPLLLMGIFTFYPLIKGVVLSFAEYNMLTGRTKWIGLENYREIFQDKYFFISLRNTFKYLIVVPPIQFFSIVLAVLVNQKLPGIKLFRTLFYIPVITGAVIVSLTWRWIYAEDGLLNYILMNLHVIKEPVLWLTDRGVALWAAMFVTFWRGLGYYMVIYLAGLQNIPNELYEAAALDGATGKKKFFYITLPLLRPSILLCSVLSTMAAFRVFEEIFLLTRGAADTSTLAYEIYDRAFVRYNFGESAAIAIVLSMMIAVFTVINFKFFGAGREKT
ncbi:MAG: putative chitobiose transport system permease protein [Kosmotoga sp.]|nr:putative chitobiose transport system permease protein [Kosmotoga sp.]MDK2953707.1 putative chitobiose transport system permease protein [Kosmotoga sp.]